MQAERIVGIKSLGIQKCVDIEIKHPEHIFIANGMAVSNSHSSSYGIRAYKTAYIKTHFPRAFFKAKLLGSQNKQDTATKVSDLVNDAKLFNVEILPPKLIDKRKTFYIQDDTVRFGVMNIKEIGESSYHKLITAIQEAETELGKSLDKFTVFEVLVFLMAAKLSNSVAVKLIESGSLDYLKVNRKNLLETFGLLAKYSVTESKAKDRLGQSENKLLVQLAKRERHTDVIALVESSLKLAKDGGVFASKGRLEEMKGELDLFKASADKRNFDNPLWVAFTEEYLFGAALTCKKIDAYDGSAANISCKEFACGREQDFMVFAVDIDEVKEYITKSGQNEGKANATIYISDATGKIRATVWSDVYEEFKELIKQGNSVIVRGERGRKKFSDTLNVKQVIQATATPSN